MTALVVVAGCATNASSSSSAAQHGEASAVVEEKGPYLSLVDLKVHDEKPAGPYLRGLDADGQFVILGDVEGDFGVPTDGEPGYLELNTRTFMSAREARAPVPPYVEGRMTSKGFVPTSRLVVR